MLQDDLLIVLQLNAALSITSFGNQLPSVGNPVGRSPLTIAERIKESQSRLSRLDTGAASVRLNLYPQANNSPLVTFVFPKPSFIVDPLTGDLRSFSVSAPVNADGSFNSGFSYASLVAADGSTFVTGITVGVSSDRPQGYAPAIILDKLNWARGEQITLSLDIHAAA